MHNYQDLITIFNHCFLHETNTQLARGTDEPLYLPSSENLPHNTIYFAHGYFASALHECAHWLIAGSERRKQIDYGYWYAPDGRTAMQQELFQRVEAKPQALEWILSMAAQFHFQISLDNLNNPNIQSDEFKDAIYQEIKIYCQQGLPNRAKKFWQSLCQFYNTPLSLHLENFDRNTI